VRLAECKIFIQILEAHGAFLNKNALHSIHMVCMFAGSAVAASVGSQQLLSQQLLVEDAAEPASVATTGIASARPGDSQFVYGSCLPYHCLM